MHRMASTEMERIAGMILDSLGEEKRKEALVAYGTVVGEIKEVSRSYKEARMALDVGKIFFEEQICNRIQFAWHRTSDLSAADPAL